MPVRVLGHRGKAEDEARNSCRSLVHSWKAKIFKVADDYVQVSPCELWPQGLITVFNGWADTYERLLCAEAMPDFVVDGIYFSVSEDAQRRWLEMKELRD